jgi:hypothetical protein
MPRGLFFFCLRWDRDCWNRLGRISPPAFYFLNEQTKATAFSATECALLGLLAVKALPLCSDERPPRRTALTAPGPGAQSPL